MRNRKIVILLISIAALFSYLVVYLVLPLPVKWAITSVVDVPVCTARVADRLGIQSDFTAVKSYILQSLKPGMTREEVNQTLRQFGPIDFDKEQATDPEVVIRLCNNPLGNVALFLYYSEDGHLFKALDAYPQ